MVFKIFGDFSVRPKKTESLHANVYIELSHRWGEKKGRKRIREREVERAEKQKSVRDGDVSNLLHHL